MSQLYFYFNGLNCQKYIINEMWFQIVLDSYVECNLHYVFNMVHMFLGKMLILAILLKLAKSKPLAPAAGSPAT